MDKPVLWHLGVSHYSEKVRWALAYKGVEHERKSSPPGVHIAVALALTRGAHKTFPLLVLEGETVAGSSAIIGALEARHPQPPLYPEDPDERRRALDLERFFDEGFGPAVRLVGWHHMVRNRESLGQIAAGNLPGALRGFGPARAGIATFAGAFVKVRYGVADPDAEAAARATILDGIEHLESELDGGEHLAGGAFSVADLTAAALLYPFVRPPEGPRLPSPPESAEPFLAELRARPFWGWVERTFARFRKPTRGGPVRRVA